VSAARPRSLWAAIPVLVLLGCHGPGAETPTTVVCSDTLAKASPDFYVDGAEHDDAEAHRRVVGCLSSSSDAPLRRQLFTAVLEKAPARAGAPRAAFELLGMEAPSKETADAYVTVADFASEKADLRTEAQALTRAAETAARLGPSGSELNSAIKFRLADVKAAQGDETGALATWKGIYESNADAVESLTRAVSLMVKQGRGSDVDALCVQLVQSRRDAQARACIDLAPIASREARDAALTLFGRLPALTRAEATRLSMAGADRRFGLLKAPECAAGEKVTVNWQAAAIGLAADAWRSLTPNGTPPDTFDPRAPTASVYERLADGTKEPHASQCFLSCAAVSCLLQLHDHKACDDPRVLARYAEAVAAHDEGNQLGRLTEALFQVKMGIYSDLGQSPATPELEALLYLHLALARIYLTKPGLSLVEQPEYHVARAQQIWSSLRHESLPVALLPQSPHASILALCQITCDDSRHLTLFSGHSYDITTVLAGVRAQPVTLHAGNKVVLDTRQGMTAFDFTTEKNTNLRVCSPHGKCFDECTNTPRGVEFPVEHDSVNVKLHCK